MKTKNIIAEKEKKEEIVHQHIVTNFGILPDEK